VSVPPWVAIVVAGALIVAVRLGGKMWLRRAVATGAVAPKRGWYIVGAIHVGTVLAIAVALLVVNGASPGAFVIVALAVLIAYGGTFLFFSGFGIQVLRDLVRTPPGPRHGRFVGDRDRRRSGGR
jgi:hypothetical protein